MLESCRPLPLALLVEGSDVVAEELGLGVGKLIVKEPVVKDIVIEDMVVEELVSNEPVIDELTADERVAEDPIVEGLPEDCAPPVSDAVSDGVSDDCAPSSVCSRLDVLGENDSLFLVVLVVLVEGYLVEFVHKELCVLPAVL